jgi:hypothetical protein
MSETGFENKPCPTCQSPMFGGWVENPIYRGVDEASIELFIGYCPKCTTVQHSIVSIN